MNGESQLEADGGIDPSASELGDALLQNLAHSLAKRISKCTIFLVKNHTLTKVSMFAS